MVAHSPSTTRSIPSDFALREMSVSHALVRELGSTVEAGVPPSEMFLLHVQEQAASNKLHAALPLALREPRFHDPNAVAITEMHREGSPWDITPAAACVIHPATRVEAVLRR